VARERGWGGLTVEPGQVATSSNVFSWRVDARVRLWGAVLRGLSDGFFSSAEIIESKLS